MCTRDIDYLHPWHWLSVIYTQSLHLWDWPYCIHDIDRFYCKSFGPIFLYITLDPPLVQGPNIFIRGTSIQRWECVCHGGGSRGGDLATGQAPILPWPVAKSPPRLPPPWWHTPSHLWIEVSEGLTMYQAPVDLTIIWWLNNHMFIVWWSPVDHMMFWAIWSGGLGEGVDYLMDTFWLSNFHLVINSCS